VGIALDAGPSAALGVPEVALEAIGVVRVLGEHPAEKRVGAPLAGVLEEALAQVHVVAAERRRAPSKSKMSTMIAPAYR
jgi:hypothetical protein